MSATGEPQADARSGIVIPSEVDRRTRYQLLTSLVVPRPIGWVSTRSANGTPNLAPFSFFGAISASPMLISLSIGMRGDKPKDSLRNIREREAFCVNVVTEGQLEAMNETAADVPPEVDEFERAGLSMVEAETVDAPYVAECPAVLECRLYREVELDPAVHLTIGEVMGVRIAEALELVEGTHFVDTHSLRPVARLWGPTYGLLKEIRALERPGR